jgi:hypothetical protein
LKEVRLRLLLFFILLAKYIFFRIASSTSVDGLRALSSLLSARISAIPAPFDYCLWLSLNPENDGTAIWVERKFDMPDSGAWASENVFSIPLARSADSRSPGLVIFECSPLHGLEDEIEKCVIQGPIERVHTTHPL